VGKCLGLYEATAVVAPFVRSVPLGLSGRVARIGTLPVSVQFAQEVLEPIGNALAYHVIVDALKNVAQPALILAAETSSSSLTYESIRLHCCL